jgi:hypothetical protein
VYSETGPEMISLVEDNKDGRGLAVLAFSPAKTGAGAAAADGDCKRKFKRKAIAYGA